MMTAAIESVAATRRVATMIRRREHRLAGVREPRATGYHGRPTQR